MSEPYLKLFVSSLPRDWDEEGVRSYFQNYGALLDCRLFRESSKSKDKSGIGCAYVTFERKAEAEEAIRKLSEAKVLVLEWNLS